MSYKDFERAAASLEEMWTENPWIVEHVKEMRKKKKDEDSGYNPWTGTVEKRTAKKPIEPTDALE